MIRICAVVTGKNLAEFLANLRAGQKQTNWVELRADYIKNFKSEDIEKIKTAVKTHSIFTCRKKSEGGRFNGSEKDRFRILESASKAGFDYIDIEFSSINKLKIKNKAKATGIIVSYHDFKKTPSQKQLERILDKMRKTKANVIKIVTKANKEIDSDRLLNLLGGKLEKEDLIILGMGPKGKITRLFSPMLGGFLTFASIGKITAPGQMTVKELKKIYNNMGIKI